eukprot:TRINITY_DN13294_c0_g1_i5.p1 TRINITY_DN13294_c0_g1~~TRINITY_DN13294_c0_g1_i5.p1  ORF type:complete len:980 (-),score=83.57 TRINITY_DN13294_c0_g1_i5:260-3199(-)
MFASHVTEGPADEALEYLRQKLGQDDLDGTQSLETSSPVRGAALSNSSPPPAVHDVQMRGDTRFVPVKRSLSAANLPKAQPLPGSAPSLARRVPSQPPPDGRPPPPSSNTNAAASRGQRPSNQPGRTTPMTPVQPPAVREARMASASPGAAARGTPRMRPDVRAAQSPGSQASSRGVSPAALWPFGHRPASARARVSPMTSTSPSSARSRFSYDSSDSARASSAYHKEQFGSPRTRPPTGASRHVLGGVPVAAPPPVCSMGKHQSAQALLARPRSARQDRDATAVPLGQRMRGRATAVRAPENAFNRRPVSPPTVQLQLTAGGIAGPAIAAHVTPATSSRSPSADRAGRGRFTGSSIPILTSPVSATSSCAASPVAPAARVLQTTPILAARILPAVAMAAVGTPQPPGSPIIGGTQIGSPQVLHSVRSVNPQHSDETAAQIRVSSPVLPARWVLASAAHMRLPSPSHTPPMSPIIAPIVRRAYSAAATCRVALESPTKTRPEEPVVVITTTGISSQQELPRSLQKSPSSEMNLPISERVRRSSSAGPCSASSARSHRTASATSTLAPADLTLQPQPSCSSHDEDQLGPLPLTPLSASPVGGASITGASPASISSQRTDPSAFYRSQCVASPARAAGRGHDEQHGHFVLKLTPDQKDQVEPEGEPAGCNNTDSDVVVTMPRQASLASVAAQLNKQESNATVDVRTLQTEGGPDSPIRDSSGWLRPPRRCVTGSNVTLSPYEETTRNNSLDILPVQPADQIKSDSVGQRQEALADVSSQHRLHASGASFVSVVRQQSSQLRSGVASPCPLLQQPGRPQNATVQPLGLMAAASASQGVRPVSSAPLVKVARMGSGAAASTPHVSNMRVEAGRTLQSKLSAPPTSRQPTGSVATSRPQAIASAVPAATYCRSLGTLHLAPQQAPRVAGGGVQTQTLVTSRPPATSPSLSRRPAEVAADTGTFKWIAKGPIGQQVESKLTKVAL